MTNTTLLIALPLVLAAIFLMYGLFRNLVRLWLDHRVKMALLEKLEHRPDLVNSVQDLQSLLESPFAQRDHVRQQDFVLTGLFLAIIGITSALLAHAFFSGRYATGVYFGGVACVPIGFGLALLGVIMKLLSRISTPHK